MKYPNGFEPKALSEAQLKRVEEGRSLGHLHFSWRGLPHNNLDIGDGLKSAAARCVRFSIEHAT